MDVIKDLATTLSRYDVRHIDVITNNESGMTLEENRYRDFYLGLRAGKWEDEEDIAAYFNYSSSEENGFRRLKDGLIDRLLNSILYVDLSGKAFTDFHRKVQEMYRFWLLAENLQRRGALTAYFDIAEKALGLAIETEMLAAIVELTRGLKVFYAIRPRYQKKFLRISDILDQYWPLYQTEVQVQKDFILLVTKFSEKKGYQKECSDIAAKLFAKYKSKISVNKCTVFNVYARLIHLYSKTLKHDWKGGIIVAENAISFLNEKPIRNREYIYLFSTQKASCLLMQQQYGKAKDILDSILYLIPEGKQSWFKNREISTINALYAEQYENAWDIVSVCMKHPQFSIVNEVDQETWRLYNGYLFLLMRNGKLVLPESILEKQSDFRLGKWLNEMPLYSQDKRGGNIPLLILQLHFLILESKNKISAFDEALNRVEALRKYASRNLNKKSEHFRTDCFLTLIHLLLKHKGRPSELDALAQPVFERMSAVKAGLLDTSFEIEIVPYERQWKWLRETIVN